MNAEWKAKWVEALRSGNYQQAQHRLKKIVIVDGQPAMGLCCLGVLCEVYDPSILADAPDITGVVYPKTGGGNGMFLPSQVADAADIGQKEQEALVCCNDSWGWSFSQIADHIEKNL